jgi:hypothetical protein
MAFGCMQCSYIQMTDKVEAESDNDARFVRSTRLQLMLFAGVQALLGGGVRGMDQVALRPLRLHGPDAA